MRLLAIVALLLATPLHAVELRFDPYRLWQGLEAYFDEGPVMFDIAVDVPNNDALVGPQYALYASDDATMHLLGVHWNRMQERQSGFYWGSSLSWIQIVPNGGAELADACRPLIPLNLAARWGYRWQVNPVFNAQLGLQVNTGQVTQRQAEQCADDGSELDLGTVQNYIDPRLDFKFSFRL